MAARSGVRKTVFVMMLFIVGVIYLTVGRVIQSESTPGGEAPKLQDLGMVVFPEPQPVATFSLVDQHGERVAKPDLRDQWTIAFLGYSGCERSACAETLDALGRLVENVSGTTGTRPQLWFVSVDPKRDTPEVLQQYIQQFDLEVRAVTGTREQLETLARSLKGAFNAKPSSTGEPAIEFSEHLGVISPDAQLLAIAQPPFDAQQLAQAYRRLVAWFEG